MSSPATPRALARTQTLARIQALALHQLAESGADGLSLRAIARELNLVSSAIYRYYPSRDELITALIINAYDDLASALSEAGLADRRGPRRRWLAATAVLRRWARGEPHRFSLLYGSPIPGYRAPQETVEPATRVVRALAGPVVDAGPRTSTGDVAISRALRRQLDATASGLELDLDPPTVNGVVLAFAGLIGFLTLELGGHFVGAFEPADDLYEGYTAELAERLGL